MSVPVLIFTKRPWNPVSWLIRWAMPRSRFALAISSHVIVRIGDTCYEATMLHGVRKGAPALILNGQTVVREVACSVPDLGAGLMWLEGQIGAKYDWAGALGLALAPDRDWAAESDWFCYELAAGFLRAAGRRVFENVSHVGETALLSISSEITAA